MSDPRVTSVPVCEQGDVLHDVRSSGEFAVSDLKVDETGAFAHLRTGVVDRLRQAQHALPDGMRLLIVEGYRPLSLQRHYFEEYGDELRAANPEWTAEQIHVAASRYVSPPEVAPHCAGAAVDLTLCGPDGTQLDMGCRINASPEESDGRCYTDAPGLTAAARHLRTVLSEALSGVGLVNYPTEWWHWSYGDRYWAMTTGAPAALYGPCSHG